MFPTLTRVMKDLDNELHVYGHKRGGFRAELVRPTDDCCYEGYSFEVVYDDLGQGESPFAAILNLESKIPEDWEPGK